VSEQQAGFRAQQRFSDPADPVPAVRSGGGTTSSMSAARPVTSIPLRTNRSRRRLANHSVGLPDDTDSRNGASPGRMKPARVSAASPGRCSDQTKLA